MAAMISEETMKNFEATEDMMLDTTSPVFFPLHGPILRSLLGTLLSTAYPIAAHVVDQAF